MHVERQIGGVEAHGIDVIEHQPHPDAPVSGGQDFPGKQFSGHITLPIVVLKIETAPGLAGKIQSETEGLKVVTNHPQAGLSFMMADSGY
jgi:hypothetical protein